jgi:N-acylneuraminate cytidylyltransferase/CMP-N,N'-diacetyllegionaminic acid synthase
MDVLTVIAARGGSKRIPNKNVLLLGGKPLIAWTIQAALDSEISQRIIVSTDSEEISEVARKWGAEVPFIRSVELSSDTASSEAVVTNVLDWLRERNEPIPECLMLLQPTSPFRTHQDIEAAVSLFRDKKADAVISVCEDPFPVTWLVQVAQDGLIIPTTGGDTPGRTYRKNGAIYVVSTPHFITEKSFALRNSFAYVMPADRSLDVDTKWDFHLAKLILEDRYANANH